jgi:hypothetical protein
MLEFPAAPLAPADFMERWLPKAFAALPLPEGAEQLDVELGVRLEGEGGGEWVAQMASGRLQVKAELRSEIGFSLVQSVEDWRGALWEGRGGVIGQGAAALFRPAGQEGAEQAGRAFALPALAALGPLRALDGLLRLVVSDGDAGDWAVAVKFGAGEIPAEATTTVTLSAEDAAAMASGDLNPLEAFMAGRIQLAGDVALMMQIQAILMQVASAGDEPG